MPERNRISVQVAESGKNELTNIATETGTNWSKVIREALLMVVTTPAYRKELVARLKTRKAVE